MIRVVLVVSHDVMHGTQQMFPKYTRPGRGTLIGLGWIIESDRRSALRLCRQRYGGVYLDRYLL